MIATLNAVSGPRSVRRQPPGASSPQDVIVIAIADTPRIRVLEACQDVSASGASFRKLWRGRSQFVAALLLATSGGCAPGSESDAGDVSHDGSFLDAKPEECAE